MLCFIFKDSVKQNKAKHLAGKQNPNQGQLARNSTLGCFFCPRPRLREVTDLAEQVITWMPASPLARVWLLDIISTDSLVHVISECPPGEVLSFSRCCPFASCATQAERRQPECLGLSLSCISDSWETADKCLSLRVGIHTVGIAMVPSSRLTPRRKQMCT